MHMAVVMLLRRGAFNHAFRSGWVACLLIASARIAFAQEQDFARMLEERAQTIASAVNELEFRSEIEALPGLSDSEAILEVGAFRLHAADASRLNPAPTAIQGPQGLVIPTERVQALLRQVLNLPSEVSGAARARANFISSFPREKVWSLLAALEIAGQFETGAQAAQSFRNVQPAGDRRALLSLIAARNLWIARAGDPPAEYVECLAEAAESGNSLISGEAALWSEGVTAPQSFEAFDLSYRIWETVKMDAGLREGPSRLARVMIDSGQSVYERLKTEPAADPVSQQAKIARTLSLLSEAGFQKQNREIVEWCFQESQGLQGPNVEDLLAPAYFRAYQLFSYEDHAAALEGFEAVFFERVSCDIAADAGRMMAVSFLAQQDPVGAAATVELVRAYYLDRAYVIEQIDQMVEATPGIQAASDETVSAFRDERFGKKIETAQARLDARNAGKAATGGGGGAGGGGN